MLGISSKGPRVEGERETKESQTLQWGMLGRALGFCKILKIGPTETNLEGEASLKSS